MIEIWTEVLPKGWEWKPDNYLGGTPEFYVNTAECASTFDDVIVYYDGKPTEHNGVFYTSRCNFFGGDIVLSCNSKAPTIGEKHIYWTNWKHITQDDCAEYSERIVLSPYQQSIFGKDSRIVPHGVWKEQFENPTKVNKRCLYSSAPDRGGEFLRKIWNDVELETGAELIATYDKKISEEQMIDLYKTSQFWLHPGQGVEMFCIAAAKAQTAKCIPVVVPNMALETTVKYGVKTTLDKYKEDLINAIKNPPPVQDVHFDSWMDVTQELFKNVI